MFQAALQQLTAVEMKTVSILWLIVMTGSVSANGASKPLPNVVAIVGKPFVHLISTEFTGTVEQYKVREHLLNKYLLFAKNLLNVWF